MRILHITPALQHPRVRGPHRHYHFLRELAARHDVTLLTLIRDHVADDDLREVGGYTDRLLAFNVNGAAPVPARGMLGYVPAIGPRLEKHLQVQGGLRDMRRAFRRLTAEGDYDVVLFHGKSVFPVIDGWQGGPVVVDFCDATSMRLASRLRATRGLAHLWLRLRHWRALRVERKLLGLTPHVAFISPRDRAAINGAGDPSPIIPNGVDLDYWTRSTPVDPPGQRIVFTGVMDYAPNDDAARYLVEAIVPRVRRAIPDLEALVVGRSPGPALRALGAGAEGVRVTGFVDDMRPYLESARVFAAPLRHASGMQNKILEAMAMGVPVLTTPVAADGIKVDGEEPPVWVASGDAAFAARLVELLSDAEARARLASAGRRFVESRFVWPQSAAMLEALCARAVATARRSPAA